MKNFKLGLITTVLVFFISCESPTPKDPSIKGGFLPSQGIPSALFEKQVVYSLVSLTSGGSAGLYYARYDKGCKIKVSDKVYTFYIDTTGNKDNEIAFWLWQDNEYREWIWHKRYTGETYKKSISLLEEGTIYKDSYTDTIPLGLQGYHPQIEARMFLAIMSTPEMITKSWYHPFLLKQLNEDSIAGVERGLTSDFLERGFNPYTQKFITKDSLLSGEQKEKKILEIGKQVSDMYKKEIFEDVERKYYWKDSRAVNDVYIKEFYIQSGDSVWFTGRIAGDSVVAFMKHD